MNWLSILTAFGLGSIVTALLQAWLSQRSKRDERNFREKQAAYVGLLEAYHRSAVEGTDDADKNFAYWQMRCELVAPEYVREAIERIVETTKIVWLGPRHTKLLKEPFGETSVSHNNEVDVSVMTCPPKLPSF